MSAASPWSSLPARLARHVGRFVAALAAALLLLELGVRALGLGVAPRGPNNALPVLADVPAEVAPGLHNALVPSSSGDVLYPGFGDVPDRTVHYRINAAGLRDADVPLARAPGTLRIACVGDSVTYGTGVEVEDSWPEQLERRLAAALPELRVEVLNGGVFAHNTSQQLAHYLYRLRAFRPDVVLLCSTVPDASGKNIDYPPEWHARPRPWQQRWIVRLGLTSGLWAEGEAVDPRVARAMWWRRRSRLADLVAHSLHGWLRGGMLHADYLRDWSADSPGRAQVRTALGELDRVVREDGARLFVTMYPTLAELDLERYPFREPADALGGMCGELGLPFLDLLPALAGREAKSLHAHAHDRHPNAEAHALASAALADWLLPELRRLSAVASR